MENENINIEISIPLSKKDYEEINRKLRQGKVSLSALDSRIQRAYIDKLQKKLNRQFPVDE